MMRHKLIALAAAVVLPATYTLGDAMLTITESYIGVPGADITEDWFEITNLGDMAWDVGISPLWYDDVSADPLDAVPIDGIGVIAPGESVIVVIGDSTDAAVFISVWDNGGILDGVQVGYAVGGAGLGQGGDGITIFDDVITPNILAFQTTGAYDLGNTQIYNPITQLYGDFAIEGVFGAYVAQGGPAGNNGEYPLIGSPGILPEPASLLMLGFGGLFLCRRRSR